MTMHMEAIVFVCLYSYIWNSTCVCTAIFGIVHVQNTCQVYEETTGTHIDLINIVALMQFL